MKYNPEIHHRKSIRLKGYDYSKEGLYFITICTQNREHLLGEVVDGKMILNDIGKIVEKWWKWLEKQYQYIKLHKFVVMPNHFHGILEIKNNVEEKIKPLGQLIGVFKTVSTKEINQLYSGRGVSRNALTKNTPTKNSCIENIIIEQLKLVQYSSGKLWQRNYYENIIRNEEAYIKVSEYIKNNPLKWEYDKYYQKP